MTLSCQELLATKLGIIILNHPVSCHRYNRIIQIFKATKFKAQPSADKVIVDFFFDHKRLLMIEFKEPV